MAPRNKMILQQNFEMIETDADISTHCYGPRSRIGGLDPLLRASITSTGLDHALVALTHFYGPRSRTGGLNPDTGGRIKVVHPKDETPLVA